MSVEAAARWGGEACLLQQSDIAAVHMLDRKRLKVNQPLENWQKLVTGMVAKF